MKFIGVDGCKKGWLSVCFEPEEIIVFDSIEELISYYQDNFTIFIDVPIGLNSAGYLHRNCEVEGRRLLPTKKKSSIFPVPCRESLHATSYDEANQINRKIIGRGLSKQTWFIMAKIREVDNYLIENPSVQKSIKESHPEISFQYLNAGQPLGYSKKKEQGIAERLEILEKFQLKASELYHQALQDYKRKDVAKDDILDAMCLAITAELSEINGKQVPANPLKDKFGIEMALHYAQIQID